MDAKTGILVYCKSNEMILPACIQHFIDRMECTGQYECRINAVTVFIAVFI